MVFFVLCGVWCGLFDLLIIVRCFDVVDFVLFVVGCWVLKIRGNDEIGGGNVM